MSQPISECLIYKACRSEDSYRILLEKMRINLKHGGFTAYDCKHDPPCVPATPDELAALDKRLVTDLKSKAGS